MKKWDERPNEVKYLLNPAFCGRILFSMINEYQKPANRAVPFPLLFMVLPLILHEDTRNAISRSTQLINWTHTHRELVCSFPARAREFVEITNETVEWLLVTGYIVVNENGEIEKSKYVRNLNKIKYTSDEISDCLRKAERVGRWFAKAGKTENIYVALGVKP